MEKKLEYWTSKKLSLACKFQIFSKVLVSNHVYYSLFWVPSQTCYDKLEKLLSNFIWANKSKRKGFHGVAWDVCFLPREVRGMNLLDHKRKIQLFVLKLSKGHNYGKFSSTTSFLLVSLSTREHKEELIFLC